MALALPALQLHTLNPGVAGLPRSLPIMQTYDRIQAAFPGGQLPATVAVQAEDVTQAGGHERHQGDDGPGARHPPDVRPGDDPRQPEPPRRGREHPDAGGRHRPRLRAGARHPARRRDPRDDRPRPRRAGRRDRHHRRLEGLQRPRQRPPAARVRVRARPGVPAAARDVPQHRRAGEGDRAEPAERRRGLRRARVDLPGRPPRGRARLPLDRRDHVLAAAVPVRDPVRPEHGLPRVHPQPDPRGRGRRAEHRGRGPRTGSSRPPAS